MKKVAKTFGVGTVTLANVCRARALCPRCSKGRPRKEKKVLICVHFKRRGSQPWTMCLSCWSDVMSLVACVVDNARLAEGPRPDRLCRGR